METTSIVLNAGFLPSEFVADIGPVASGYAPLGNKPLLLKQLESLPNSDRILIAHRELDSIPAWVARHLDTRVDSVVGGRSMGESLALALTKVQDNQALRIIVADTLQTWSGTPDAITISSSASRGNWTQVVKDERGRITFIHSEFAAGSPSIVTGQFNVRDAKYLKSLISLQTPGSVDFWAVLEQYSESNPFTVEEVNDWLDFGHLENVYESRKAILGSRSHNEVVVSPRLTSIWKSSSDTDKLAAEVEWFSSIPQNLRVHTPQLLNVNAMRGSYELEYVGLPTVAEVMLCGQLPESYWERLFECIDNFVMLCKTSPEAPVTLTSQRISRAVHSMLVDKVVTRLEQTSQLEALWPSRIGSARVPTPSEVVQFYLDHVASLVDSRTWEVSWIHGDLFAGNMFFDRRAGILKVVDPRGDFGGMGAYGPILYDIAKLRHSFVHGYDFLAAGFFGWDSSGPSESLVFPPNAYRDSGGVNVAMAALETLEYRLDVDRFSVDVTEAGLFLSMLPLHGESQQRQRAAVHQGLTILRDYL